MHANDNDVNNFYLTEKYKSFLPFQISLSYLFYTDSKLHLIAYLFDINIHSHRKCVLIKGKFFTLFYAKLSVGESVEWMSCGLGRIFEFSWNVCWDCCCKMTKDISSSMNFNANIFQISKSDLKFDLFWEILKVKITTVQ